MIVQSSQEKTANAPEPSLSAAPKRLVQRKCACSGSLSGDCEDCKNKKLQRYPNSRTTLIGSSGALAQAFAFAPPRDSSRSGPPLDGAQNGSAPVEPATAPAATSAAETAGAAAQTAGLIVEDDAPELGPGQMHKTEFLDQLRTDVCAAADAELAAVGRSTAGCPYVERWIGHYRTRSVQHIERALRRYAPEATGLSEARGYIPLVAARVRRAVTVWATTGQLTGVPDELASELTGVGVLGALGGAVSAVASAAASVFGGIGRAIGGLFTKAKEGGAHAPDDPQQIQSQLSGGQSLDGGVKSRMENAFGHDFSRVRVHAGSQAAGLSASLNARAFTIGDNVAFGAGEYQPGTLTGDALIAHELAHVVQQQGAVSYSSESSQSEPLEEEADRAAVGAVLSTWGGKRVASTNVSQQLLPQLKSGLGLRRCSRDPKFSTATCSNPVKTLGIDILTLRGASRSGASDVAFANQVFKPCCVQFSVGKDETASDTNSNTWLGGDKDLNKSTACGTPSTEETALYNGAATTHGLSARFRAFYVETISGSPRAYSLPPYCATGAQASLVNMMAVSNSGQDRSLAHELGHILLNSDKHTGIDDPSTTDNLMVPTNTATGETLDATQCTKIYGNA